MVQPNAAVTPELNNSDRLEELEVRVQSKLCGRVRDLQLFFLDCGIVLRGFARSYHAKQLAQHVLMGVTALPILANEIEVY